MQHQKIGFPLSRITNLKKKLFITNKRMLSWKDYSIQEGFALNQKDWCEKIGFPPTNIRQVKSGLQGFSVVQILAAARLIDGNINWLFGRSGQMIQGREKDPVKMIKGLLQGLQDR